MRLRFPVLASALLFAASFLPAQQPVNLTIDANATTTPFPHFWEQTFGSGRAILALRDSYRRDLRTVKEATNFQSVRFHGILMDEVGLYDPDRQTKNPGLAAVAANDASVYNFSYVDQIYDGLLDNGVRPFVELSFMPRKLAADPNALHAFWYHPNVSPPADYAKWDAMISAFAQHLISRYGIEEVSTWKFEVWNEPNLDFWGGNPKQATYFELYDHTARAIKSVSPRLQIGGPSTAQAAWVTPFLAHVHENNVPIDFVSTHVYANDLAKDVFGAEGSNPAETIPRDQMVYRSVRKVHDQIAASAFPHLPLIFSEYNASYANEPNITDSIYLGSWLANTIRQCDGLVSNMAYWSFSDVFEEQGVVRTPFYGGYGLLAADNIPKPSLNAFRALHKLGDRRIAVDSDSALATTTASHSLTLALWNYAPPDGTGATYTKPASPAGPSKTFHLEIKNASNSEVTIWRVDEDHGNVLKAFDAMGRPPADLTRTQIEQLQAAGAMAPPEHTHLVNGKLDLTIPAHGLAVLTFNR
ncbi:GH39 family glycosyl hydrolase [Terracidiphilus gabretensis]|uniref:GH39 family glycosyl hydrolase n=1 Tax=Terracidiphilus gabretensis TaxID=1577687 RepID=UPI00071B80BD|nr:glycosyl hydrolase family 39 [Terracidiphilus gabretensis]